MSQWRKSLIQRKYCRLFSSKEPMKPGPKGPSQEVIAASRRHETAEPELAVPADRAADHRGFSVFPSSIWIASCSGPRLISSGSSSSSSSTPTSIAHIRGCRAPAGAEPGHRRRSGQSPSVSVAAALSWAVSHTARRGRGQSATRSLQRSTNSPLTSDRHTHWNPSALPPSTVRERLDRCH